MLEFLEALCRNGLTIVGAAAFGLGGGALGTHGLLTAMFGEIKQDGWGAGPIWLLFMAIGGCVGLIAGLVWVVSWIRGRGPVAWRPVEWLALALGLAVGVAMIQFVSDRYYLFMKCLIAGVIVPPCAVVGRAVGGLIASEREK